MTQQEHITALQAAYAAMVLARETYLDAIDAYATAQRLAALEGIQAPRFSENRMGDLPQLIINSVTTVELLREAPRPVRIR